MKLDFDNRAKSWDDPKKIERAKLFSIKILENVPMNNSMTALDYGCGTGALSFFLQPYLKKIVLCDTSQGMLDVVKAKIDSQKINNMFPLKMDISQDHIINEQVDIIYTLMTLHHIPDIKKILKTFFNLNKDGGYLYIADLDKEDGSFHSEFSDFDGHYGFDQQNLKNTLLECGYSNITSSIFYTIEKSVNNKTMRFPCL